MLVSKAVNGFIIAKRADGFSEATLEVYTWALKQLITHSADCELTKVTPSLMQSFFGALRKRQLSERSVECVWTAIRSFFGWCTVTLNIQRPDMAIKRPRYQKPIIQPFSVDEIHRLLKACERSSIAVTTRRTPFTMPRPTAKRDAAILLMLLDTGLRISELARLSIDDVNLDTGEVMVKRYGSGLKTKGRTVYIGKAARKSLWLYLESRKDESRRLFVTLNLLPLNKDNARDMMQRLGDTANVPGTHPHRFRHTFAVEYLRGGGDVFTLQRLLGHSSLDMVKRYLEISTADVAEAHRRASPADRIIL